VADFFNDVGLSVAWAFIGVVLLFVATLAFDALHPLKIRHLIEEGNIAAGIVLGSVAIAMGLIITAALS
jgi:uncharacterized membrane protein YjfL (UPF0719 family)